MHHFRMSEKEKLYLQDQLRAEQLCLKKAQMYLQQTRDSAVQGLLQQCIDKSQRHVNALQGLLQEAGFNVPQH